MIAIVLAMITGPSDEELVRRFKEGDETAYAEFVRRYQHRVYSLAFRWIGDERIAEEVAQDVFVSLYKSMGRFRGEAQLSTWVYRVVVNHCKNRRLYRMRRHVDRHEPLEGTRGEDEPQRQIASEAPGTDHRVHRAEARALVQEALAQLDEEQRLIIVLRDVEDRSYEEISDILGLPRGTVKSRLHRARAQLARVLRRHLRSEDVL